MFEGQDKPTETCQVGSQVACQANTAGGVALERQLENGEEAP